MSRDEVVQALQYQVDHFGYYHLFRGVEPFRVMVELGVLEAFYSSFRIYNGGNMSGEEGPYLFVDESIFLDTDGVTRQSPDTFLGPQVAKEGWNVSRPVAERVRELAAEITDE